MSLDFIAGVALGLGLVFVLPVLVFLVALLALIVPKALVAWAGGLVIFSILLWAFTTYQSTNKVP